MTQPAVYPWPKAADLEDKVSLRESGLNVRTFSRQVGGRTSQPFIPNTLTLSGVCNAIILIGCI